MEEAAAESAKRYNFNVVEAVKIKLAKMREFKK